MKNLSSQRPAFVFPQRVIGFQIDLLNVGASVGKGGDLAEILFEIIDIGDQRTAQKNGGEGGLIQFP